MSAEQYANNAASTLASAVPNATVTNLTVASAATFPQVPQFRIVVDQEIMIVTAVSGATFTVTRGAEGTTAANHSQGAPVTHLLTAAALLALLSGVVPVGTLASYMDAGSLVFGDVADPGWSQISPTQLPGVSIDTHQFAQPDGLLDAALANYTAAAPGYGGLEHTFTAPPNVTVVQFAAVMRLPSGVNAATVRLQIGNVPFSTDLGHIDVNLTSNYATYVTPPVAVTPGTAYMARILLNSPGTQAQALVERCAVQVVTATDPFWLLPFTRIEPRPQFLRNNGYFNQRLTASLGVPPYYWMVSPHSQLELDTNAQNVVLELMGDVSSVTGAQTLRVDVNGRAYAFPSLPGSSSSMGMLKVALPAGFKRVTITNGGGQGGPGGTGQGGPQSVAECIMTGVYVDAGAHVDVVFPMRQRSQAVVYGDSKLCGQTTSLFQASGLPGLLRRKCPADVAFDAWGGRALSDESTVSVTKQAAYLGNYDGGTYFVGIGRNDQVNSTWASAAAFGTRYAQMLDAIHAAVPRATLVVCTPSTETSEGGNNANGWSMSDLRAQIAGAYATRAAFCKLVDLSTLWAPSQGGTYTSDGVHPNDLGCALVSDALLGPDGFGVTQLPITGPLSFYSLQCWHDAVACVQAAGVITACPDLSGNGVTLTPTNSPTLLSQDVNGHPAMKFVSGSSQYLIKTNSPLFTGASGFTLLIVLKFDVTGGNPMPWTNGQANTATGALLWSAGVGRTVATSGGSFSGDGPATTNYEIWLVTFINGTQVTLSVNGTAQTMSALTALTSPQATDPLVLGAGYTSGAAANFSSSKIATHALWNRILSANEQTALTRWAGNKYGITVP